MYDEEFDHKHDRSDCIVDTSIVSNQFQHSKDTAYKGSTDDFLISIGGAFPVVNLLANFLAGTGISFNQRRCV